MPSEQMIARVMKETGMDRLQAIRHLRQREWIKTLPNRLG